MTNSIRSLALALLLAAGYAAPAGAVQSVDVSITEYFDPSTFEGFFEVTNNSASNTLHYVAVANDAIDLVSAYNDWQSYIISRGEWEAGWGFDMTYQPGPAADPNDPNVPWGTAAISWATYFGDAQQVAAYASNIGLAPGESSSQFGFSSVALASPFIAFDQNGAVMASGATTEILAVPEASSAAMFGVGVLMLVWAVGRRRKGAQALFAA